MGPSLAEYVSLRRKCGTQKKYVSYPWNTVNTLLCTLTLMFLVLLKGDTSSHYSIYRQKVGNQERIVNRFDVFPSHADIIVTLKGSNAVHPVFRVRADAILKDSEFRGL